MNVLKKIWSISESLLDETYFSLNSQAEPVTTDTFNFNSMSYGSSNINHERITKLAARIGILCYPAGLYITE